MFDQIDDMQHIDISECNWRLTKDNPVFKCFSSKNYTSKIILSLYWYIFSYCYAITVKIISVFLITLFTKK